MVRLSIGTLKEASMVEYFSERRSSRCRRAAIAQSSPRSLTFENLARWRNRKRDKWDRDKLPVNKLSGSLDLRFRCFRNAGNKQLRGDFHGVPRLRPNPEDRDVGAAHRETGDVIESKVARG